MFSWTASLFPFELPTIRFPSLSIPANIQRRFVSFILRRSLGRFVRPGQLDDHQIDSQIGSGSLEISQIQLSDEGVNELLNGLPVQLRGGSIGKISAKIPWSNIWKAPLEVTIEALEVGVVLSRVTPTTPPTIDLTSSVTNAAETFVHQELDSVENRAFLQTIHQSRATNVPKPTEATVPEPEMRLPGGFDSLNADDRDRSPDEFDGMEEAEEVSFLTSMTESLLSRLRVTIVNTSLTVIHDAHVEVCIQIPEMTFGTEDTLETPPTPPAGPETQDSPAEAAPPPIRLSVTRTFRMSDLSISMNDLRNVHSPPLSRPLHASTRSDDYEESSSEDEMPPAHMSQSVLSVKSSASMYLSALSLPPPPNDEAAAISTPPPVMSTAPSRPASVPVLRIQDPIVVQVISHPSASYRNVASSASRPKVVVNASIGVIGVALQSWQVRALLECTQFIPSSPQHPSPPPAIPRAPSIRDTMLITFQIRSMVALLMSPQSSRSHRTEYISGIESFFEKPLLSHVSSRIPHIRLQLDHFEANFSKKLDLTPTPSLSTELSSHINDLFVMYFALPAPLSSDHLDSLDNDMTVSPILIFDPNLVHTPNAARTNAFPFVDPTPEWEKQGTMLRPSVWRAKAPQPSRRDALAASMVLPSEKRQMISIEQRNAEPLEVSLLPLHFFVDLNVVSSFLIPFLDDLTPAVSFDEDSDEEDGSIGSIESEEDEFTNNQADAAIMETPRPRKLELEADNSPGPSRVAQQPSSPPAQFVINCSVVRLEVRTPPSFSKGYPIPSRSGTVLVDLYGLVVRSAPPPEPSESSGRRTAFAIDGGHPLPSARSSKHNPGVLLAQAEWSHILIAFAAVGEAKATTHVSITSLASLDPLGGANDDADPLEIPLLPRLTVRKSITESAASATSPAKTVSKIYVDCALPQIRISMAKAPLDGLQLWADDLSQWANRLATAAMSPSPYGDELGDELIGSRFFARRAAKSLASSTTASSSGRTRSSAPPKDETHSSETIVSISITEMLWIPRQDSAVFDEAVARPLKLSASDVAVVLHTQPDGRDETVVDVAVLDVKLTDTLVSEETATLLFLTRPRTMNAELKPMVQLRFASVSVSDAVAKESRIRTSLHGLTFVMNADIKWINDVAAFAKAPPGAFETVVPSERTVLTLQLSDCSVQLRSPSHQGSVVFALNDVDFGIDIVGNSPKLEIRLRVPSAWILAIDTLDAMSEPKASSRGRIKQASDYWRRSGFARLVEIRDLALSFKRHAGTGAVKNSVDITRLDLFITLCTDTMSSVSGFISDFSNTISPPAPPAEIRREGSVLRRGSRDVMTSSVDEHAFARPPEFTADADMIRDDLPSNIDYLEDSFGAAAGFRDITEDDLEDFDDPEAAFAAYAYPTMNTAKEEARILDPLGVRPVEYYFDNLPPEDLAPRTDNVITSIRAQKCNATLSLYSGFEWKRTQSVVKQEVDAMRRRLLKIRHLVSAGDAPHEEIEEAHATLFNSVYIGLPPEVDDLEGEALLAAIDEQLEDDADETASQGSWQTLDNVRIPSTIGAGVSYQEPPRAHLHPQRLTRSKRPSIEFCFYGLEVENDFYPAQSEMASRLLVTAKDVEILDHLRTSTWKKFLTQMREDSRGNVRETDSSMVRLELINVRPVAGELAEECRLRMKILPLRLHVDQDALDFIKNFFAFSDPDAAPPPAEPENSNATFFQHVDIFPVELKLDYKPKRVDYRALREGRTIELMNFFHFDGSEMTLRHIEMFGETGWGPMLEKLNDLWSPDVKAHQLAEVISGIEPIRSFVNVGSGVADLVLLPIAQYQKDGRIMRGIQKGTTSFVKTTAIEALTIGARLATGTQVILEQAENMLGGPGPSASAQAELENSLLRWESVGTVGEDEFADDDDDELEYGIPGEEMTRSVADLSRYAHQPTNVREGLQSAYKSLGKNLGEAAQTILAVPIEVYERAGTEGPVRAVVRALPVAVLKPMIGASEAVSKTLLGLRGSLDPHTRDNIAAKYKRL
ncbi:hypothetical protein DL93DRAFT_2165719 [Clavulina sp. PMI_390]|nr:hypothetical protein DL93DRAFT_2165719 [Clavulina sp. PMI_390]